jgi:hypothetical protein
MSDMRFSLDPTLVECMYIFIEGLQEFKATIVENIDLSQGRLAFHMRLEDLAVTRTVVLTTEGELRPLSIERTAKNLLLQQHLEAAVQALEARTQAFCTVDGMKVCAQPAFVQADGAYQKQHDAELDAASTLIADVPADMESCILDSYAHLCEGQTSVALLMQAVSDTMAKQMHSSADGHRPTKRAAKRARQRANRRARPAAAVL